MHTHRLSVLAMAAAGISSIAVAAPITTSPGLLPGAQYRLVFVTATFYQALSSDITVYNGEVNTEASIVPELAALGTTWFDIGSTATVNAIDNIGQDPGVPIYNLQGELVANDATTAGMFSGSLLQSIHYDENGIARSFFPWTGSLATGRGKPPNYLGSTFTGTGLSVITNRAWIAVNGNQPSTENRSLYGISDVLTVGAAIPEPTTTGMAITGLAILYFGRRLHHRHRRCCSLLM